MPGAWPGTTKPISPDAVQNQRKASTPKLLSPLDNNTKELNENDRRKSVSIKSASRRGSKRNPTDENTEDKDIIDSNAFNRHNSLTPSAAARRNSNITSRGSITSVGAVLAGATLAISTGSTEVATQLLSPEGSVRRKSSIQQIDSSSSKGKNRLNITLNPAYNLRFKTLFIYHNLNYHS